MSFGIRDSELNAQGLQVRPGLALAYPEIQPILNKIIENHAYHMQDVIPDTWYADTIVAANRANGNGNVLALYPAQSANGTANFGIPEWLANNPAAQSRWQQTYNLQQQALAAYAAGKQTEGAAALQQLRDNAAYWNKIAEGGATVAGAVSGGLSRATTILVVGGALALLGLWFWKDPAGFKNFFGKLIPGKK